MLSWTAMASADLWSIGWRIIAAFPECRAPFFNVFPGCREYGSVGKEIAISKNSRHMRNMLSFSTLSALKTIHAKGAPVFKGDEFYGLLDGGPEGGTSLQMERESDAHAARRRVLDRAMPARDDAFRAINALAGDLADVVKLHLDRNDGEVDINRVASWYGFDVITTLAFGQSLDLLQSPDYRWLPRCLQDASVFLYWAGFFRYGLAGWRWLLGSRWPARLGWHTAVEAQRYAGLADDQVHRRAERLAREDEEKATAAAAAPETEEEETERRGPADQPRRNKPRGSDDIFGQLLRANLYSRIDLRADSSLLIAAGSDAVRFTIAATLHQWTTPQRSSSASLARATAEVRASGLTPATVTDAAVLGAPLRYVRACVDEAMRLSPPKPSSIPREVSGASGGAWSMVVDGVAVPPGATVGVCTYALHRDPDIYAPDPHVFRPERWLARPLDARMLAAFCPFLKGPRACPGKTVAYMAVQVALFHLLYAFDVEGAAAAGEAPLRLTMMEMMGEAEGMISRTVIGLLDILRR
ncbi:Cytochrome P450 monooxygenase [Apiospora kogelbergensis]|uniref:Cytochrome P450 monooxygenase n=1 Tax=Apiospora kogelbergensis TaxID=1337665 RepID=A0AAW0QKN4_9PEZI